MDSGANTVVVDHSIHTGARVLGYKLQSIIAYCFRKEMIPQDCPRRFADLLFMLVP